jgi:hypothetical protein
VDAILIVEVRGIEFYSLCRANNFKLAFTGDKIPCITLEDKSRLNIQKRNTPGGQGNINGGGYGK